MTDTFNSEDVINGIAKGFENFLRNQPPYGNLSTENIAKAISKGVENLLRDKYDYGGLRYTLSGAIAKGITERVEIATPKNSWSTEKPSKPGYYACRYADRQIIPFLIYIERDDYFEKQEDLFLGHEFCKVELPD